jgi:hypothetical protein
MQKILKFVVVGQLHAKIIQNCLLAAVDGGLIGPNRVGHFGFCALLPEKLFDQPPLLRGQGTDSTAQIVIRRMRSVSISRR